MNIWVWKVRIYELWIINNQQELIINIERNTQRIVNNPDDKWSFHVAYLQGTGKKCTEIKKKHVKGVQSFCFRSLTMQNLWRCRCRRVVDLKLPICVKNPNERGTCEWRLLTKTTSEHNPLQSTFCVVSCFLHIRREFSLKQFSERKLERKTH